MSATEEVFTAHRDAVRAEQEMFDAEARYQEATAAGNVVEANVASADWLAAQLVNSMATRQLNASFTEFDAEIEAGL